MVHTMISFCRRQVWTTNNKRSERSTEGKERGGHFWSLSSQLKSHNGVNWLNCAVSLCVFQGHTYVNLTELDLKTDSQSEAASVTNDSSMSFPKSDSLSSQMAKLSKYCTQIDFYIAHILSWQA